MVRPCWNSRSTTLANTEPRHSCRARSRGTEKPLKPDSSTRNTPAATWFERAAHADHAASQFQLAVMYCTGQGVPKDLAHAVIWYELAARLGHALAQYNLAVMVTKGQGCEPDPAKAIEFFRMAAEQGMPEGQMALAEIYRTGRGVPRDEAAARRWYEQAARQGHQGAANILRQVAS